MSVSTKINAFFACSRSKPDSPVNDHFRAIANGMNINCSNLDYASKRTPPEESKALIEGADLVIVVAVRREKVHGKEKYRMPPAVEAEMIFAFAKEKAVICFAEEGVDMDSGYNANLGTYLTFTRNSLSEPPFLQTAIRSMQSFKEGTIGEHQALIEERYADVSLSGIVHSYDLEKENEDFVWQHSSERVVQHDDSSSKKIRLFTWNTMMDGHADDDSGPI